MMDDAAFKKAMESETALILEAFPYGDALARCRNSMAEKIERLSPGTPFPSNDECRNLMARAIKQELCGDDAHTILVDWDMLRRFTPRPQHFVANAACDIFLSDCASAVEA